MMKKFLILLLLIIILVAVSWFRPAFCESLDNKNLQSYLLQKNNQTDTGYVTQNLYGIPPENAIPIDSSIDSLTSGHKEKITRLEPFGYSLFASPAELLPPSELAAATDYILGPGDNLIIYIWGRVETEYNLTIDRQGKLFIPKAGEIIAWGMSLEDFQTRVRQKLEGVYTDFKVSVSLGKIRSIRVYLTGEVKKPGAYTVSSLTTLFNALYLAGGPNQRGSMREIKLIRNNRVETSADLYQFLLKGDSRSDIRLSSGDAVFIPVSGPRVTIKGEIKRPAIYELKGSETIGELMELAGGPTAEAYLDRLMLVRISPDDERHVIDLNLNDAIGEVDDIELIDGDDLTIFSIYDMKRNVVAVAGMVKHPGQFERTDSTTLRSLLDQAELLPSDVYFDRANLFRRYADRRVEIIPIDLKEVIDGSMDYPLCDLDSLHIYSIDEVKRKEYVSIEGEVKKPGQYPLYDNMTVEDLIFMAGSLNKNANQINIELARTDSLGGVSAIKIDLTDPGMHHYRLCEDDRLFVRKIPEWSHQLTATIDGEVMYPGQYALLSKNETLYDLIQRAGGFTENAFPKGTIFTRNTISRDLERQKLPEIIAHTHPLREDSTGNIQRVELGVFHPNDVNRIIIDINQIMNSNGKQGNLVLQNEDYVYVPDIPTGVSVMGAVGANGTIKYVAGKNTKYYIERAGNFTNQADKKGTRLIKADGRVFSGGGTIGKRVELGDVLYVPIEIKKDRDWLKTISTTVSIIGGIATSVFIIDRL
nr:SLBB domain-containing protein [candidate division Zixibacteria bacterium]